MKAYVLNELNSADGLQLEELPQPTLKPGEVLIETKAIDINPVDNKTLQGKGQYGNIKDDRPVILGWGISGIVTEVAEDVTGIRVGEEVFGLVNFPGHGKTYATYVAAPADQLAQKPSSITHDVAAALTLSALMAYQALSKAKIKPGERVLIQGIAGGVGFPALQIAKQMGAFVIGTALPSDMERLRQAGADELIDFTKTDFSQVLKDVDFVFDTLGGDNVTKAFNILAPQGRLITIPSGGSEEWRLIARERGINAEFLFVHSSGPDMQAIAELAASGNLVPNIAQRFGFSDIPEIHRAMLDRKISGKSVVEITE